MDGMHVKSLRIDGWIYKSHQDLAETVQSVATAAFAMLLLLLLCCLLVWDYSRSTSAESISLS